MRWLLSWWFPVTVDSITSDLAKALTRLLEYEAQNNFAIAELTTKLDAMEIESARAARVASKLSDLLD